jgi:hypothetical protein
VELQNISGKTITSADLGVDPHILLAGRGNWINAFPASSGGTPAKLRLSDVKMRLPANLSIPPSGLVYFTTDGGTFPCDSQSGLLGTTPQTATNSRLEPKQGSGISSILVETPQHPLQRDLRIIILPRVQPIVAPRYATLSTTRSRLSLRAIQINRRDSSSLVPRELSTAHSGFIPLFDNIFTGIHKIQPGAQPA